MIKRLSICVLAAVLVFLAYQAADDKLAALGQQKPEVIVIDVKDHNEGIADYILFTGDYPAWCRKHRLDPNKARRVRWRVPGFPSVDQVQYSWKDPKNYASWYLPASNPASMPTTYKTTGKFRWAVYADGSKEQVEFFPKEKEFLLSQVPTAPESVVTWWRSVMVPYIASNGKPYWRRDYRKVKDFGMWPSVAPIGGPDWLLAPWQKEPYKTEFQAAGVDPSTQPAMR